MIDLGSIHSFVDPSIAKTLKLDIEPFPSPKRVSSQWPRNVVCGLLSTVLVENAGRMVWF